MSLPLAVTHLLELARTAEDSSNFTEAFAYYARVLESDPTHWQACYGKAVAAGWQSSLNGFRFSELTNGITRAIELAPEDQRPMLRSRAAIEVNMIATACWNLARDHKNEYLRVAGVFQKFIDRCKSLLDLYSFSFDLFPTEGAVQSISVICEDNMQPVEFMTYGRDHARLQVRPEYI
jgi:hypothetical protein